MRQVRHVKSVSLAVMSILYVLGGSYHFISPGTYLKIMPPYLPAHLPLVYVSGAAEMGLGALLWVPRLRSLAAWGIVALLLAVFPANLYMYQQGGPAFDLPDWALLIRLPLQGLLIGWAYWHTRDR
jgi:uncharacterized membrane protein